MSTPLPSAPGAPQPARRKPIWKRWWFWVAALVVIGIVIPNVGDETDGCRQPADAWLTTLQDSFYDMFRNRPVDALGYVETDTSEGKAYYVAVKVHDVEGVAVFGTSEPPLQSDPGLIAAANSNASFISDLGADISKDSPAGRLLLADDGISAAESCA